MVEHPPQISVVMPVYNSEKYLADSIESILNQTYTDFEFLIVDDGSNRATKDIVAQYANMDGRIKIHTNSENTGIHYSRNHGNRTARGKYIANMDADDISLPDRFDKQVEYLEQHPEIAVLGAQIIAIDVNHKEIWRTSYPLSPGLLRWGLSVNNTIKQSSSYDAPGVIFRVRFSIWDGNYRRGLCPLDQYQSPV